ncbi:hypothetical protein K431DRAFT_286268 [Polychaeton citri CBS 116435]|uniref:Uncharacterized protein n=1 Tax=Polychaeton citri CBS 116435 TaxID=1314669 RepID=A0A9P4UP02_9PEZI|nr:hypothetical protein K431DRAFT_286268 [Polychaeton citri CBS 116435]
MYIPCAVASVSVARTSIDNIQPPPRIWTVIATVSSNVGAKIAKIHYDVVDDNGEVDEVSRAIAKVPIRDKKVRKKRLASIAPRTLSQMCRQIRADVLRLFYSKNKSIAGRRTQAFLLHYVPTHSDCFTPETSPSSAQRHVNRTSSCYNGFGALERIATT